MLEYVKKILENPDLIVSWCLVLGLLVSFVGSLLKLIPGYRKRGKEIEAAGEKIQTSDKQLMSAIQGVQEFRRAVKEVHNLLARGEVEAAAARFAELDIAEAIKGFAIDLGIENELQAKVQEHTNRNET